jgi:hypothetical protein
MSATVFVEWNDGGGAQRVSFEVDWRPAELHEWVREDAGLSEAITAAEDEIGTYLEDVFEARGAGWLIAQDGDREAAEDLLRRVREALGGTGEGA